MSLMLHDAACAGCGRDTVSRIATETAAARASQATIPARLSPRTMPLTTGRLYPGQIAESKGRAVDPGRK